MTGVQAADVSPGRRTKGAGTVLLVDEDASWRTQAAAVLHGVGYDVLSLGDRWRIAEMEANGPVDLVVLSAEFPIYDAGVAKLLRQWSHPPKLLLLCPPGKIAERAESLNAGADDCRPKPEDPLGLTAQIEIVLAMGPPPLRSLSGSWIEFRGWRLFVDSKRLISPCGAECGLQPSEFRLLMAFLESRGRVLSRRQLHTAVGLGQDIVVRVLDCRIARLRRTLAHLDDAGGRLIRTVRSEGYQFVAAVGFKEAGVHRRSGERRPATPGIE